ncbi:hypothetical protein KM043_016653 [Ampulex compressa]|nr:hypothetical protein KM043_016653 [Ampulex compressa]
MRQVRAVERAEMDFVEERLRDKLEETLVGCCCDIRRAHAIPQHGRHNGAKNATKSLTVERARVASWEYLPQTAVSSPLFHWLDDADANFALYKIGIRQLSIG